MQIIPKLTSLEILNGFKKAKQSERNRFPKILHKKGDYDNRVFNFLLKDTYMQPHRHPGKEKIEKMSIIEGVCALFYFDDYGNIIEQKLLEPKRQNYVEVPAFTWHTYLMKTEKVLIYETMNGVYDPENWKDLAPWAPSENSNYLFYQKKLLNRSF